MHSTREDISENELIYYTCDICGKTEQKSIINRCAICDQQLCDNCSHNNLCPDHFKLLQEKNSDLLHEYNSFQNLSKLIFLIYTIILVLVLTLVAFNSITKFIHDPPNVGESKFENVFITFGVGAGIGLLLALVYSFLKSRYKNRMSEKLHEN